jgi:hypothetical protein
VSATLLGTVLAANGCATAGDDDGNNRRPQPDGGQTPPPYDGGGGSGGFRPDDSGSGTDCPEIGDNLGRTMRISRCPPRAGETLVVTGTGWPAQASIDLRFCAPSIAPNIERSCPWTDTLAVGADGTFATQFDPRSVFPVNYGATAFGSALLLDCAAAPGACTVEVREATAPESSALRAPYTPLPDLNRKAALDLRAPLIADLPVRFLGTGWSTGVSVSAWLCGGPVPFAGFSQGFRFCNGRALFDSDAAGSFRIYAPVPGTFQYFNFGPPGVVDCQNTACQWLFVDGKSAAPSIPLPLSNSPELEVATQYGPTWESLLQQGVSRSGRSDADVQRIGAAMLLWTMTAGGSVSEVHLPHDGATTHVTRYSRADYLLYTTYAAQFDYTLDELQKIGALFWSWLLAERPPLPEDPSTIP